jgi:hypothetical protein
MNNSTNRPKPENPEDDSDGSFRLAIEHVFSDELRTLFSNHITVQHNEEGEFTISFYDVIPPLILGEREDIRKQLDMVESVKAHCIARIAISAGRMPKLIAALATTFDAYLKSQSKPEPKTHGKKHAI